MAANLTTLGSYYAPSGEIKVGEVHDFPSTSFLSFENSDINSYPNREETASSFMYTQTEKTPSSGSVTAVKMSAGSIRGLSDSTNTNTRKHKNVPESQHSGIMGLNLNSPNSKMSPLLSITNPTYIPILGSFAYSYSGVSGNRASSSFQPLFPAHIDRVYESAAKLLFFSVKWIRGISSFLQLHFRDQAILLEDSWSDVFVLSAAQWGFPLHEGVLSMSATLSPEKRVVVVNQLQLMKDVMSQLTSLQVNSTEYAYLKTILLFKPEVHGLRDPLQVELLQDQTQLMLHEYVLTKQPPSKVRFGKLLLVLSVVRRISSHAIEEAFFRKTIGNIPIERLLCDMFHAT
ncbi:photoreceptor-specific nuclear receptor-like [Limulus polyphemus]|uniref:Photoreceptor-specific nuclear receptor-like n=1 Tax=Limulus polyphemus TaxID=6850 RepID=A0ABM1BN80_LIMPO|nr:photoreceptor-specific nuclear receptor-like [Limulus polyphemus]